MHTHAVCVHMVYALELEWGTRVRGYPRVHVRLAGPSPDKRTPLGLATPTLSCHIYKISSELSRSPHPKRQALDNSISQVAAHVCHLAKKL